MQIYNHEKIESLKKQLIRIQPESDEFYSETPHRLLDIFSHSLDMEEAQSVSFTFEDLYLKYEKNFISLFEELYKKSPAKSIIIEMPFNEINEQTHLAVLEQVDRLQQFKWIKLLKQTNIDSDAQFFTVESFEGLKLIYQINSREVFFCNLHFQAFGFSIRGYFDRSMEVFFESEKAIQTFTEIVENNGLFLREYPEELERGL